MADYLIMGTQAFRDGMSEDQIKFQHPQFRAAFRKAKKNFETQQMPVSALRPEKVVDQSTLPCWVFEWRELEAITRRKPYDILNQYDCTRVWANALRKVVWDNRAKITKHKHAVQMVDTIWCGILQKGFNEGVLTEEEVGNYGYIPTQLREQK